MNLCCFLVVEKWTPIVLILDHILQVPRNNTPAVRHTEASVRADVLSGHSALYRLYSTKQTNTNAFQQIFLNCSLWPVYQANMLAKISLPT